MRACHPRVTPRAEPAPVFEGGSLGPAWPANGLNAPRDPAPPGHGVRWAVSFISHGGVKALAASLSFYDKKTYKNDMDLELMAELVR